MNLAFAAAIGGIALVDLVLSGDNALVIGAAASQLPRAQRLLAIGWGGIGAIMLRLALALMATELLRVPYLEAAGGVILLGIAVKLLLPEAEKDVQPHRSGRFFSAIVTIMIADLTMSLDNVLAVSALANGNIPLLAGGLILSMSLLFVASAVIARLIAVIPWLIDVAALVLGWTAANLVMADHEFVSSLHLAARYGIVVHLAFLVVVLLADSVVRMVHRVRAGRQAIQVGRTRATSSPVVETIPDTTNDSN